MPNGLPASTHPAQRNRRSALLPSLPKPADTRNLPEQIAASLQAAILSGRLGSGARLIEAAIADQMRTSRGPVRDALLLLERDGLIVKLPNRGARVLHFDPRGLREATSLRAVLEEFAVALLTPNITAPQLKSLHGLVEKMESAARRNDVRDFNDADYRFHDALCAASGHGTLHTMWRGMAHRVRTFLGSSNLASGNLQTVARRHRALYAALATRKNAAARQAIRAHFAALERELSSMLAEATGHDLV